MQIESCDLQPQRGQRHSGLLRRDVVIRTVVGTYEVWWDTKLSEYIIKAGKQLCNFHVSDCLMKNIETHLDSEKTGDVQI